MDDRSFLQPLLAPASVALIGASDNAARLTARPMRFLQAHGFKGRIFPVNPARATVLGMPAFASVGDIPARVDHAYVLVDRDPAIAAVAACAAAGVRVVSVLADGFAEAGPEGRRRQDEITAVADRAGMLLIGPNSMGVVAPAAGFVCTTNPAFAAERVGRGRFAVLSQSGSVIGTLFSRGQTRGLDFSALISVGNEAQTGIGRLGQILLDDPGTDGFLLFMETIRDRAALARFARDAAGQGKPVVAYMIGRSDEGQALAVSHTGALTGGRAAIDAFLARAGIRRVDQFESLIEAPPALAHVRLHADRPRTVTVVSTTGGGGAMVVDQISVRGIEIAAASPAARAVLAAQGIPLGHGKLVDVTLAGARYAAMKAVISTLLADPATGLLVVAIGSSAQFNPELAVDPIVDAVREAAPGAAPVLAFPLPHAAASMQRLAEGGVPTFRTVEACAETVALILRSAEIAPPVAARALPDLVAAVIDAAPVGTLDEVRSGEIFAALGLRRPRQVLHAVADAIPATLPFGWPVVAKLVSADLPHKTEAGAIRLGIDQSAALETAIAEMTREVQSRRPDARITGVLIQETCRGLGEALIGLNRDPIAGPVITVAMGGTLAEIYRDRSIRPAPVSQDEARAMVAEVKGFALLRGYRGAQLGDLEALAEAVRLVSDLAVHARVLEAEVNPVLVMPEAQGVVMLDALVTLG